MTVFVLRNGELVVKAQNRDNFSRGIAPLFLPHISRLEPYRSPVTGKEITSWGQREKDLAASNSYDPRDNSKGYVPSRGREVQLKEAQNARSEPHQLDFWK